ncbi:hypothetical protein VP01_495g4 [Puccinia sorghi]|uniref:Uncharacterized protein n=1 Tax=Puccinia sorghi TaxID=27349 RepID=A0A0L6ULX9_9BASI|nr:hypothetical protein VP01_495g4 [Puccinia sorghi]
MENASCPQFQRNPNNPAAQSSQRPPSETNPSSTQQKSLPATPRRPGHAKGSQGYSIVDCAALVDAVKTFLPVLKSGARYLIDTATW